MFYTIWHTSQVPKKGKMSGLTPMLQQQQEEEQQIYDRGSAREVDVWVRDANGARNGVRMPISSTFNDVMQKVRERHGHFQFQGVVGFEGEQNERTTVAEMLTAKPNDKNEEDYLYEHPIQPKFKVRKV
jgi:hypothetical protein